MDGKGSLSPIDLDAFNAPANSPEVAARNKALDLAAKIARSYSGQFTTAAWQIPDRIAMQIEALKQEGGN